MIFTTESFVRIRIKGGPAVEVPLGDFSYAQVFAAAHATPDGPLLPSPEHGDRGRALWAHAVVLRRSEDVLRDLASKGGG
jgi:hypothetical protein